MLQRDKLLQRIKSLAPDIRFEELKKILKSFGYEMSAQKEVAAMKTIDEYINLPYRIELTPDVEEGGFVVSFPELPGCISTINRMIKRDVIEDACLPT